MATRFSILAWKISWTEEPGRLQSMRSQRVGRDWVTNTHTYVNRHTNYQIQNFHVNLQVWALLAKVGDDGGSFKGYLRYTQHLW